MGKSKTRNRHSAFANLKSVFSVLSICFFGLRFAGYALIPRFTSSLKTIASATSFMDLRRWRLCR